MDWASLIGLKDLGLVTIFGFLVGFGYLIPRWMHKERIADLKEQLVAKKEEVTFLQAALKERDAQVSQLATNNSLAVNALEAIRREVARA